MDCYYCKAKEYCIAAAQPGSMICLVNRMRYGGTHADDETSELTKKQWGWILGRFSRAE